jgi:GNAT superfamily N-acetyltransferase
MSEEIKVRIGTPADIHGVMELAKLALEETDLAPINQEKILHEIWSALCLEGSIFGVIGKPGERVEAGVLLRIGQIWYSDNPVLEERIIFVHPDFRSARGGRAAKLCKFAKETADRMGMPLMVGVLSSNRTTAKIRMHERHFGSPAGIFFFYNGRSESNENRP